VHAKTGSMTGVTALSGYVTAADGRRLVFSVVLNDHLSAAPRDIEDAIAVRLAGYDGADDRPELFRVPEPRTWPDNPRTDVDEGDLECSWVKAC